MPKKLLDEFNEPEEPVIEEVSVVEVPKPVEYTKKYHEVTWQGIPMFQCDLCPIDMFLEQEMIKHVQGHESQSRPPNHSEVI